MADGSPAGRGNLAILHFRSNPRRAIDTLYPHLVWGIMRQIEEVIRASEHVERESWERIKVAGAYCL